jgi:tetratricopeptide (TPR) repeat protein
MPASPGRSGRPAEAPRIGNAVVRRGAHRSEIGLILGVAVALGLTAWQARRSEAIDEALAAYDGREAPLNAHSVWARVLAAWDGTRPRGVPGGTRRPSIHLALQRALDHLVRHPRDPRAARLAALCLSRLDYAHRGEPYYALARAGGSLSLDDRRVRALGLARGNLREQALAAFQEILAQRAEDADALQRLAAIYYSLSRYSDTLRTAERLVKAPGGAVAGSALIGIVYHDGHKHDEAIAAYEQVLALDPELNHLRLPSSLFYTDLAEDLIDAGRPADARRHLLRALSREHDAVLMDLLGTAYRLEGRDEEAEQCWKAASEWGPNLDKPWLNRGMLALEGNRLDEAIECLQRAHARGRDSIKTVYQLSIAYRRAGRMADAERFRRQADQLRRKRGAGSRSQTRLPGAAP